MLCEDEITVRIGRSVAILRPTLRAALRLERQFGGFDRLITAIQDESVSAMAAVIRECSDVATDIPRIIEGLADMPLCEGIEAFKQPLIDHVVRLAGYDEDAPETPDDPKAARMTFAEYHAKLYRLATGWLGWSPETAWTATAAEIIESYKGRVEMLQAIHGAPEPEAKPDASDDKVRAIFQGFGTRKVSA